MAKDYIEDSALPAFLKIIDNSILKHVVDCTNAEAKRQDPEKPFVITKEDLLAFIGVQFCGGIYCIGVPIRYLWSERYGVGIVKKLMSKNKFVNIMRYLRFNDKGTRESRVKEDRFALCRWIWDKFIENSRYF